MAVGMSVCQILLSVRSSINPFLKFISGIFYDFDDNTSRCDLNINHTFYDNPMRTQLFFPIYFAAIAVIYVAMAGCLSVSRGSTKFMKIKYSKYNTTSPHCQQEL